MDQLISSSVWDISEDCLKALGSFCPTLLRAQCNMLLVTLMVINGHRAFPVAAATACYCIEQ